MQKREETLAEKLAAYKDSLSKEEIKQLIADTKHLKQYQEEPSPKEDLAKIPMLKREDMKREAAPLYNTMKKCGDTTVVHHEMFQMVLIICASSLISVIWRSKICRMLDFKIYPWLYGYRAVRIFRTGK